MKLKYLVLGAVSSILFTPQVGFSQTSEGFQNCMISARAMSPAETATCQRVNELEQIITLSPNSQEKNAVQKELQQLISQQRPNTQAAEQVQVPSTPKKPMSRAEAMRKAREIRKAQQKLKNAYQILVQVNNQIQVGGSNNTQVNQQDAAQVQEALRQLGETKQALTQVNNQVQVGEVVIQL